MVHALVLGEKHVEILLGAMRESDRSGDESSLLAAFEIMDVMYGDFYTKVMLKRACDRYDAEHVEGAS